ncbi:hypothetical protein [Microcoleus sp. herbarium14]|uniref:hypothetical protein n=1 Tax=Microcoleus sp. herbarium14 TaxID=3055439 RepID=UPI002FCF0360
MRSPGARATPTSATRSGRSHPKLYGVKMINLILLALLLAIGSILTQVLVLLPLSVSGWLHLPNWLSLTLILLAISWCLGD